MNDVKSALASKTVWGGILAVVAPIAGHFLHVSITDVDTQQLADILSGLVTAIGGVLAIVGRIVATKAIG